MTGHLAILASHPVQYYAPLFRELARRMDVTVFYAHRPTPEQQGAAGFGASFDWDIDLLSGYPSRFLQNVARQPGVDRFAGCDTPGIGAALAQHSVDALLVMGWYLKSFWQGAWAAKRRALPVLVRGDSQIATPRSSAKRLLKTALYPALLRIFDAALYVGRRNRAYYEHYGYPAERLFFSPHCVDTERFASSVTSDTRTGLRDQLGIAQDDKVVLFAGKLIEFKRPLDVIDAAALMQDQGCPIRVLIAGSGPLESELKARANEANVVVHSLGFQNQTAMPVVYAAADVLALPSTGRESWGLVCNEALACGTPIVVSEAVGCAPDLASDGAAGRTFPVGDTGALASALHGVLHNPPPRDAMARISDRYSLASAADGILEALRG